MGRPPSIISFERLYLGSIALYILNAALFWSQMRGAMDQSPQIQANPDMATVVGGIMVGSLVVTVLVSILFWWLVARQASVAGKWLVVGTEAIGALFALFALYKLATGSSPNPAGTAVGLVVTGLAIAAAAMLFRPDAKVWLGEDETVSDEPLT